MKKVLIGLAVVLTLLAGLVLYQRHRVAKSLQGLFPGKTFSSFGVKVEIPPFSGSVRGFFRLHVKVPRVDFDLSAWGLRGPLQMEDAEVFQNLWQEDSLILEIPRKLSPRPGWTVGYPSAHLGWNGEIRALNARAIIFEEKGAPTSLPNMSLSNPELRLGSFTQAFPQPMMASIDELTYRSEKEGKPREIRMDFLQLGLDSKKAGETRHWEIFSSAKGGVSRYPVDTLEFGGWKLRIRGTAKEVPQEEFQNLVQSFHQTWGFLVSPFTYANWMMGKGRGNEEGKNVLLGFFNQIGKFLDQSQWRVNSKDFDWEGLKSLDAQGKEKVVISPLAFHAELPEENGGLAVNADGHLDRIWVAQEKDHPLILEGVRGHYHAKYTLSFSDLIEFTLKYYASLLNSTQVRDPRDKLGEMMVTSLALYPNEAGLNFKIDRMDYGSKDFSAVHRNFNADFFIKPEEAGFKMNDDFSFKSKNEPKKDIEGGRGEWSFALKLPWEDLENISRQALRTASPPENLASPFINHPPRMDFRFHLDLGLRYFVFDMHAQLSLPLDRALEAAGEMKTEDQDKARLSWWNRFRPQLVRQFDEAGSFLFELQVDRLSKFQAALEQVKSGASWGLLLFAPYTVVDSGADRLSMKLQFDDGKVLLNGQPNAALQKMMEPIFQKYGTPSGGENTLTTPFPTPSPASKI